MTTTLDAARAWMKNDPDPDTRAELAALLADPQKNSVELEDRFARTLEFGTAGLRGVIGAGPNRMNRAVVRRTSYALGKEVLAKYVQNTSKSSNKSGQNEGSASAPSIVIGYDGRRLSYEFAHDSAKVLVALGVRVHLFDTVAPTPFTAFALKDLKADAGVMVTASHNPPEYNGYKVYWSTGAQIVPPIDSEVAKLIESAPPACDVPLGDLDDAKKRGLFFAIGHEMAEKYLAGIAALTRPDRARSERDFKIVYTALHGVGNALCTKALANAGFSSVSSVPEQKDPDGKFPTVAFPNPEEKGAMDLSFSLARKENAWLILANDPDADRLAVAIPDASSPTKYWQLTGNDVGVLLGHWILTRDAAAPAHKRIALASIVSSPMLGVIAKKLGVRYEETLTGFKWIEHRAMEVEHETGERLAFGYEEALGYSIGELVRDKDGISAAVVFAELVADLKAQKKTVRDKLDELFREYGLFVSGQVNIAKKGIKGPEEIQAIMNTLRQDAPKALAGIRVTSTADYQSRERTAADGKKSKIALPESNVLAFDLEGGSRVIARPSGTEPKIKFYFDVREDMTKDEDMTVATKRAKDKLERIKSDFVKLAAPEDAKEAKK